MRTGVNGIMSIVALAAGCTVACVAPAQAYYLDLSGTLTGRDAGQLLLGSPKLSAPVQASLTLYSNPNPIMELIVTDSGTTSYTFFLDQPAGVLLDQADPQKLSLAFKFGNAGYHSADEHFLRPSDGSSGAASDQAAILAGGGQTTSFRRDDLESDGTAAAILVDPFRIAFSATSLNSQQRSDFFLEVTKLRFADVGLTVVPLPSSAPMFGAAVLALGLVGYSAARRA